MLLVLIVTSGFAIVRTAIPPWWIWAYWISPFAYGLRAIVINEMTAPSWSYADATTPPGSTVGIQGLQSFGFQTERCASCRFLFHRHHSQIFVTALLYSLINLDIYGPFLLPSLPRMSSTLSWLTSGCTQATGFLPMSCP